MGVNLSSNLHDVIYSWLSVSVLNYPSGDLSSSVCELELPGYLAIRVIWERGVNILSNCIICLVNDLFIAKDLRLRRSLFKLLGVGRTLTKR